ncbi:MAG: type II secretion system F family protein [Sulfuricella sp.]|nr:type II secretion system F family protein [Sulfuricella sp.]
MRYEIRGLSSDRVTTLFVDAANESDARRHAAAQSLRVLSIKQKNQSAGLRLTRHKHNFSLILFTQELLALLEAGLTVVEGIDTLLDNKHRPEAHNVLTRLHQNLLEGKSFSGALGDVTEIFPPLYVSIVRAAERTSNLPEALGRYIDYQVRLDSVKAKVISASIYPVILLVVGSGVALFLMGYVVPRFASVYQGTGRQLPWMSSLLMDWGNLVSKHRHEVFSGMLATLAITGLAIRQLLRQGGIVRLLQHIPFFAESIKIFQLARLYLTLGMLLDGGLPIVQSLNLVGPTLSPELRGRAENATQAIQRGESISQALNRFALTTPVGLRMLRVGEQSGRIGEMMTRTAKFYDGEISRSIEWFSKIFEPVLMAAIGVVVGTIVILLYMPIFDLAGSLQ